MKMIISFLYHSVLCSYIGLMILLFYSVFEDSLDGGTVYLDLCDLANFRHTYFANGARDIFTLCSTSKQFEFQRCGSFERHISLKSST